MECPDAENLFYRIIFTSLIYLWNVFSQAGYETLKG